MDDAALCYSDIPNHLYFWQAFSFTIKTTLDPGSPAILNKMRSHAGPTYKTVLHI